MPGMGHLEAGTPPRCRLSGPEDVEDDQDFGALVNAERQEPVLAKLGLAELRLVPARVNRPGVPWRIGQLNDPFHERVIDALVAHEVTELRGGPPGQGPPVAHCRSAQPGTGVRSSGRASRAACAETSNCGSA